MHLIGSLKLVSRWCWWPQCI